jgi:hypothetical protein
MNLTTNRSDDVMSFNRKKKVKAQKREPKLRLKPFGRHVHGEVTADGHHMYCARCDVFVTAGATACGNCELVQEEEVA